MNTYSTQHTSTAKYYRHENQEDLPGDDTFGNYIIPRYVPYRFNISVFDGQLNIM